MFFYTLKHKKTMETKSVSIVGSLENYLKSNPEWERIRGYTLVKYGSWVERKEFYGTEHELKCFLKNNSEWVLRQPVPMSTGVIGDWGWREKLKRAQPGFAEVMKQKAQLSPQGSEMRQKWG